MTATPSGGSCLRFLSGAAKGRTQADTSVQLLLDARSISASDISRISSILIADGVSADRIIVPSTDSFKPIEIVLPDGTIIER